MQELNKYLDECSVLLTTYNSGKFIDEAIRSILRQTYRNFELVIIDDGSEDNTKEIVESFSDDRIVYKYIMHVGRSKALNYGFTICKYDWIALMDADDIAHPKRLEIQFKEDLKFNNVVIASAAHFKKNKILSKIDVKNLKFPNDLVLHQKFPNSVLFNKNYVLQNGGYSDQLKVAEDYEMFLRIRSKTEFLIIPKVLMFIRNSQVSLSRNNVAETNTTIYSIQDKYYKDLGINFNIHNINKQNAIRGWREYFYGKPKMARRYWLSSPYNILKPRILMAYFLCFFSQNKLESFKSSNIKFRASFFIQGILGQNKELTRSFEDTLKRINLSKQTTN